MLSDQYGLADDGYTAYLEDEARRASTSYERFLEETRDGHLCSPEEYVLGWAVQSYDRWLRVNR
jgi:hypothetical protein